MRTQRTIQTPVQFHFKSTVYSHGWSALHPYRVKEQPVTLWYDLRLTARSIVRLELREGPNNNILALIHSSSNIQPKTIAAVATRIKSLMQADLDLRPFYEMVRNDSRFNWAEKAGAGRMLRGDSFYEDAVKTIMTTNCSWSLTTSMNANLIQHFGQVNKAGYAAFPTPEAVADSSIEYLRRECRLGYRSDYVFKLSQRIAQGTLAIEDFRTSAAPAKELFAELTSIKGIGEYAAANLMRMLGKFDYLGLDSWCRNKIAELYGNGTPLPDKKIERIYESYGEWKGLAMWLDVTRHWYRDKFPLT